MKHYDHLQKHRATVPYDPDEPPCPPEGKRPAWTEEKARAQREWFAEQERRERAGEPTDPQWDELQANLRRARDQQQARTTTTKALAGPRGEDRSGAERTQSNPRENLVCDPPTGKPAAADDAPAAERSQQADYPVGHKADDDRGTP